MMAIDEPMKMFYKKIEGIDPDECVALEGDLSKLEIEVNGNRTTLEGFLKGRTRLVSMDHHSTKDIAEEATALARMPKYLAEQLNKRYFKLIRNWWVLENESRKIGLADDILLYNGFPSMISLEEYMRHVQDPPAVYSRMFERCTEVSSILAVPPETQRQLTVRFHKDFLAECKIYGGKK